MRRVTSMPRPSGFRYNLPAGFFALVLSFVLLSFQTVRLNAQDGSTIGPQAGQELAAALRAMRPDHEVEWTGALQIFGRENKVPPVPISFHSTLTSSNWSFIYQTAATETMGAEKLTIVFSTNAPNEYFYARAASPAALLSEPKRLAAAEADVSLAGSDFWLSDLGFEFFHWPEQERKKGEQRRGRGCYVIVSRNPHPEPGGYLRVMTWVDEKTDEPLEATAYGADGHELKRFEVGKVQKVNGNWEPKALKMFNEKTGSRTELNFDLQEK